MSVVSLLFPQARPLGMPAEAADVGGRHRDVARTASRSERLRSAECRVEQLRDLVLEAREAMRVAVRRALDVLSTASHVEELSLRPKDE